jgi:hypothetical protein
MKPNKKNYPLLEDIDNLHDPHHSILLYEKQQYAQIVKSRFVENGLKKKEHTFCVTHDDVKYIENELAASGIDVDYFKQKNFLHIYQVDNIMEHKDGVKRGCEELIATFTKNLKPPYRFVGRIIPDVSTRKGIIAELEIEHHFHSQFYNYQLTSLCTYKVQDIEENQRSVWLGQLCENHHNLIYAVEPENAVVFDPDLVN